jgi:hypothetical protein
VSKLVLNEQKTDFFNRITGVIFHLVEGSVLIFAFRLTVIMSNIKVVCGGRQKIAI